MLLRVEAFVGLAVVSVVVKQAAGKQERYRLAEGQRPINAGGAEEQRQEFNGDNREDYSAAERYDCGVARAAGGGEIGGDVNGYAVEQESDPEDFGKLADNLVDRGIGFINKEIGNLFGVEIKNQRSQGADRKAEFESVADKGVDPFPFFAAIVNGQDRLHAVADGRYRGILHQQEVIDDGESNYAVKADVFNQRNVKQHQDNADGALGDKFGNAVIAGAHKTPPAFEFERKFENTAGVKIMAEQKDGGE